MITVEAATAAWLGKKSANTQRAYTKALELWQEFCEKGQVDPLDPAVVDVDRFQTGLLAATAASTVAQRVAAVRSWHAYLRLNELMTSQASMLAAPVTFDRNYSATRSLSEGEVAKMLIEADRRAESAAEMTERQRYTIVRDAAIVRLLVVLGLRENEAASLNVESLGFDGGERVVDIIGKGGRRTRRFVPDSLYTSLARYFELAGHTSGPMFRTELGDRICSASLYAVVRRVAEAAGLTDVHPHMLRHSMAAMATEAGAELDQLQDAMGHADPKTTRRYQGAVLRMKHDPARLMEASLRELAAA